MFSADLRGTLCRHLLVAAVVGVPLGRAQTVVLDTPGGGDRASLGFGWDPIWDLELGYAHGFEAMIGDQDVQLDAALTLPFMALAEPNFKVNLGLGTLVQLYDALQIGVAVHTGLALSTDPTGTKLGWTTQIAIQPGYFVERWQIALDLAWRASVATYFWHSDVVRDLFRDRYPVASALAGSESGPSDGWYAFPANRLRIGVVARVRIVSMVALFATVGFDWTPASTGILVNPSIGHMPFYGVIGGSLQW